MCTSTTDLTQSAQPALEFGRVYTQSPWRVQWLADKLAAVAKKAARSGIHTSPAVRTLGEPYSVWSKARGADWMVARCPDGMCIAVDSPREKCEPQVCPMHWREEIVQDFRAEGEMPVLPGGWHLVAAIDRERLSPDAPIVSIVREAPGRVCPLEFRGDNAANRCDHCEVRRGRKTVYVLANLDGKHIQVGSSCVAEFIRDANVEAAIDAILAAQAAWAGVPTEDEDGNPLVSAARRAGPQALHTYLAHVAAYTRDNHGCYLTRAQAGDGSTGDQAFNAMTARDKQERKAFPDLRTATDSLVATAAIEWAKALPADGNTFEQNMRTFATAGFFTVKHKGVAAYIVAAYHKATRVNDAPVRKAPAGRLQAEPGSKAQREVEIVRVHSYESMYGTGYITVMRVVSGDDAGAIVKWMSKETPMVRSAHAMAQVQRADDELEGIRPWPQHAGAATREQTETWIKGEMESPAQAPAQAGDRVTIAFKVKAHGEYKGALETTVSHVKRVCQGWGYACEAGTDEARIRDAQIAAGNNAPVGKTKPARKPRAKKVQSLTVDATQTA